jgi:protein O-mannosyl-transferase
MLVTGEKPIFQFWREALILCVIVFVAYSPTFWNGFVYDDEVYVLQNPLLKGPLDLREIFTKSYPPNRPEQGLYRPFVTLSFFLDAKIWGFASLGNWNGFHFTNVCIHSLNVLLFLFLLQRLGLSRNVAFFSALVFAIHPALSEAVAWVVGRAELLGLTFGLVSLLFFFNKKTQVNVIAAFSFWFLAMLCKEHWLVLPALAALISFTVVSERMKFKRALSLIAISMVVAVCFWIIRSKILGSWHPSIAAYEDVVTPISRIGTGLAVLWRYVGIWIWPFHLSIQHDVAPVESWVIIAALILAWFVIFWIAWKARVTFPWFSLAAGWFWISILLVSNLIIPIGTVMGERFLYLSTLFFPPFLILILRRSFASRLNRKLAFVIGWGVCLFLSIGLWIRLGDWKSDLTLWRSAADEYPSSMGIKAVWSDALLREGDRLMFVGMKTNESTKKLEDLRKASEQYTQAHLRAAEANETLRHSPSTYQKLIQNKVIQIDATAQMRIRQVEYLQAFADANEQAQNKNHKAALEEYQKLIRDFPEQAQTYEALADLYIRIQNPMGARQQYEEALRLGAGTSPLWSKYGQSLSETGLKAEALMAYDRSLKLNPNDPLTHFLRGHVLGELGDFETGLEAFKYSAKLTPSSPDPYLGAAEMLIYLKRYPEAKTQIEKVLSIDPQNKAVEELLKRIPLPLNPNQKAQ